MSTLFARTQLARAQRGMWRFIDTLAQYDAYENDDLPDESPLEEHHRVKFKKAVNWDGVEGTFYLGAKSHFHVGLVLMLMSANDLAQYVKEQMARYDRYQVRREVATGRAVWRGRFSDEHNVKHAIRQLDDLGELVVDNRLRVPVLAKVFAANEHRFEHR